MASGNEPNPNNAHIVNSVDDFGVKTIDFVSVNRKYFLLFVGNGLYFIVAWAGSLQLRVIVEPSNVTITQGGTSNKVLTLTPTSADNSIKIELVEI